MTPNNRMVELPHLEEFLEIAAEYKMSSVWCRDAVFLFSGSVAIIFHDLIQDDEIDVFLYDRLRRRCTANMYGIADRIVGPDQRPLNQLAESYFKKIDFARISVNRDRKKESLSFSLALLKLYGHRILCESLSMDFDEIFTTPILQTTDEWEQCMQI
jgi:hypothetical protein